MNEYRSQKLRNWESKYAEFYEKLTDFKCDFYVAVTRKGYYFGKALGLNFSTSDLKYQVLRDRDIFKCYDFSVFCNKKVLLFDDTANSGKTLERLCDLLNRNTNYTVEIIVESFAISQWLLQNGKKKFKDADFYFHYLLTENQMADFSLYQLKKIHDSMIPYVVDLPFFKKVFLRKEVFQTLVSPHGGNWNFHDYTFTLQEENYTSGFFLYENSLMQNIFENNMLLSVIKCRYQEIEGLEESGYEVVFTPFVILKSMQYDDIRDCFCRIYQNTPYVKFASNTLSGKKDDYIGLYRDVVYNLSYFIGTIFRKYISERYGISLDWDLNLSQSKQNQVLKDSINTLFADFSVEKYLLKLYNKEFTHHARPNLQISQYEDTAFEDVKDYMLGEFALRKLASLSDKRKPYLISLEEIEEMVARRFSFQSEKQYQLYLVKLILLALDCSIISNDLLLTSKDEIRRVFRYGECSELVFSYDSTLFFAALYAFYNNKSISNKEKYQRNFKFFAAHLKEYLLSNGYFKYKYITKEAFDFFVRYFDLDINLIERELANKRYICEGKDATNPYIKEVENFISRIKYE